MTASSRPGEGTRATTSERTKVTVPTIRNRKTRGERISVLTAYDATFARMADEGGIDAILVGDSLGMVVQGLDSTLPVTVDEMLYHCRAVARGASHALLIGDLPFMSYQVSETDALRTAGRFLAEGGMHAVKLEGGRVMASTITRLVSVGIPVMGHIGLTPQSVHAMGGFRVQGRADEDRARLLDDALAVEAAGAFALVLEGIPSTLARAITEKLSIPTIGIGAGIDCDGQVLVGYDMLGLTPTLRPKFVKRYAELYDAGRAAIASYVDEVQRRVFPDDEHSFGDTAAPKAARAGGAGYGPSDTDPSRGAR